MSIKITEETVKYKGSPAAIMKAMSSSLSTIMVSYDERGVVFAEDSLFVLLDMVKAGLEKHIEKKIKDGKGFNPKSIGMLRPNADLSKPKLV